MGDVGAVIGLGDAFDELNHQVRRFVVGEPLASE
jgi:hypothetical protein